MDWLFLGQAPDIGGGFTFCFLSDRSGILALTNSDNNIQLFDGLLGKWSQPINASSVIGGLNPYSVAVLDRFTDTLVIANGQSVTQIQYNHVTGTLTKRFSVSYPPYVWVPIFKDWTIGTYTWQFTGYVNTFPQFPFLIFLQANNQDGINAALIGISIYTLRPYVVIIIASQLPRESANYSVQTSNLFPVGSNYLRKGGLVITNRPPLFLGSYRIYGNTEGFTGAPLQLLTPNYVTVQWGFQVGGTVPTVPLSGLSIEEATPIADAGMYSGLVGYAFDSGAAVSATPYPDNESLYQFTLPGGINLAPITLTNPTSPFVPSTTAQAMILAGKPYLINFDGHVNSVPMGAWSLDFVLSSVSMHNTYNMTRGTAK